MLYGEDVSFQRKRKGTTSFVEKNDSEKNIIFSLSLMFTHTTKKKRMRQCTYPTTTNLTSFFDIMFA